MNTMPRTPEYEDDVVNAFRSKRLVFRALEDDDEDMACLHQYANDPVISLMGTNRLFKPQDEQQTQMVLWPSPDTLLMVLICLSPEEQELQKAGSTDGSNLARAQKPRPIGIMQLYDHAREKAHNRSAKLAVSVFTGFRGRGYGSEAVNWVLDWAFRRANMHVRLSHMWPLDWISKKTDATSYAAHWSPGP